MELDDEEEGGALVELLLTLVVFSMEMKEEEDEEKRLEQLEMKEMEVARVWPLVKRSEKKGIEMKRKRLYRILDL